jgi:SAM-dependent methyltransferase
MTAQPSAAEIEDRLRSVKWFLRFEIVPGVFSPGLFDFHAESYADSLGIPERLDGLRALDIGTWDGPMAFELERRGAQVVALDIQYPDKTGFNIAKELKQSRVEYVRGSVYDLSRLLREPFDLVTFLGVYYHLKYPVLAFDNIASVTREGGTLCFSGECLISYAETLDNTPVPDVEDMGRSDVPIALCYPGIFKKEGNWTIPNLACIRSWLTTAGFELLSHEFLHDRESEPFPIQRVSGRAIRTGGPQTIEHPLVGVHFFK